MNGILLIDKPAGWTSNDVVQKLRGVLHERRIGHSGTLDPMATGLLVVFVGRATRAVQFAEADSKRYTAALRLGVATDTQDSSGNITARSDMPVSADMLLPALDSFRGDILQTPPMYSAIKINGRKLYEIARKGGEVERRPREVNISSLTLLGQDDRGDWTLDVQCSKGTYIRTLCSDIGEKLGCGGCMSALRRVRAGCFELKDAYTLEEIIAAAEDERAEDCLIPVDRLFTAYPEYTAPREDEARLRVGAAVDAETADGIYRVYSTAGDFLLLGDCRDGRLSTIKSFFEV